MRLEGLHSQSCGLSAVSSHSGAYLGTRPLAVFGLDPNSSEMLGWSPAKGCLAGLRTVCLAKRCWFQGQFWVPTQHRRCLRWRSSFSARLTRHNQNLAKFLVAGSRAKSCTALQPSKPCVVCKGICCFGSVLQATLPLGGMRVRATLHTPVHQASVQALGTLAAYVCIRKTCF